MTKSKIRKDLEFKPHKDDKLQRVKFEDFIKGYYVGYKGVNNILNGVASVTVVDLIAYAQPNDSCLDTRQIVIVPYSTNEDHATPGGSVRGDIDANSVDDVCVMLYGVSKDVIFVLQVTDRNEVIRQT